MGNYLGAWDEMLDRWFDIYSDNSVKSWEHRAIAPNDQMGKNDGAGYAWDENQKSILNKFEFCSMVGHDCDVRVFLFPIIEERLMVVIETYNRAEGDVSIYEQFEYYLWDEQDIYDVWAMWRMCGDQSNTYATSSVEIMINFAMAGFKSNGAELIEIFTATLQKEYATPYNIAYEAIGFSEFATRVYAMMHETEESPSVKAFVEQLWLDFGLRHVGVPYRVKAFFFMW